MNKLADFVWPTGEQFSIVEGLYGDIGFRLDDTYIKLPPEMYTPLYEAMLAHGLAGNIGTTHPSPVDPSEDSNDPDQAAPWCEIGIATDPRTTMLNALRTAMPALEMLPDKDMHRLVDAACSAYGRHQMGEAYGLPPYEPSTCGTQHLLAERFLRLLGKGTPFDALPSGENWAVLSEAVDDAGVAFAREWLVRNARPQIDDGDIPF